MKRKIIEINEEKCNGCGECVDICAEVALKIIDGKAKLTRDFYCDGMGACLDVCPTGALKIVEKEALEYDVKKTIKHVKEIRGEEAVENVHGAKESGHKGKTGEKLACGCPGSMMQDFRDDDEVDNHEQVNINSELRQWPVQGHLISPEAPYFKDADIVIVADCVPFSYANFHQRFLKNKALIMFCPKLDQGQEIYLEKLTEIFKNCNVKSITTVRMEVPCCGGITNLVEEALRDSGKNIIMKDCVISIKGEIV